MIPSPPKLSELPRGTQLRAGLGVSTIMADMDFETYSPAGFVWDEKLNKWGCLPNAIKKGLPVVGAVVYTEHPDAGVLSLAYNLKDGFCSKLWRPGEPNPYELFDFIKDGGLIEAWNCNFEYWVWNNICVPKYGWPVLFPHQLRDAMAKSRAHALPGGLEAAADVLKLSQRKDKRGKYLLNKFSIPRNPTKNDARLRILPYLQDSDSRALYEYNLQDIQTEAEASSLIPDLSEDELQFWLCDQAINIRGVQIDLESINSCIDIVEQAHAKYNAKLRELTNNEVTRASEVQKLIRWLATKDVKINQLDQTHVEELFARENIPAEVINVLKIRELLGSAAVKKLYAMRNQVSRQGRLHNLFIYHSARTGRAAGAGPQPQNLPNSGPRVHRCDCGRYMPFDRSLCLWCGYETGGPDNNGNSFNGVEWNVQSVEDALTTIATHDLNCVEFFWDNAIETVSGCLRGLFISAPHYDLICSDYSAIEAVVLAALANETWRMEVFKTHGKIYEMSAAKISNTPFDEIVNHFNNTGMHHPLRKLGKVAELASGYQGWTGAWKKFGADQFFSEDEMKHAILEWRKASPKIVQMWGGQQRNWQPDFFGLEGMAVLAVMHPGQEFGYHGITYKVHQNILYCKLLSGRYITYHNPQLNPDPVRGTLQLSFEGWNTNPNYGVVGWHRMTTYGGKLTENVVQATARDILAHAIVNLEKANYPVVLHIHDEIVSEIPENHGSIKEFEKIMSTMPEWAKDWPIYAKGGWRGKRYRKE